MNIGQGQDVKYLKYLPQYMYILKNCPYNIPPSKLFKTCKQFDFTAAILLNGGCVGQIKVRCEMFDTFEIAIHISIH